MMDVSIIICCYNGKSHLWPALEHIAHQQVGDVSVEFIFVDNASTDGSADFVREVWKQLDTKIPLTILTERKPGLVHARQCGVKAAQGKYIIFCDDDNWLREDYAQNAYRLMEQMPNVGVLGGQSILAPGIEVPDWWEKEQGNYAVGKQLPQTGMANERGFVYGAGVVTRLELAREILDDRYPFLLTGRKGDTCLSGEDWEYCTRVRIMGYDLYYSEDLFYWHDVDPKRLTMKYLNGLLKSFDEGAIVEEKYDYVMQFANVCWFEKLKWLLIRLVNDKVATTTKKERKRQLLDYHLYICGLNKKPDYEFDIINGFMKYARQLRG